MNELSELIDRLVRETNRLSEMGAQCTYQEFEQLVELRQTLINAIELNGHNLTDEHRKKIQSLSPLDEIILGHMHRLREEAREGIVKMNQSKRQAAVYQQQPAYESILFDKRN